VDLPPEEELVSMSDEQLRVWRRKKRTERLILRQKERKRERDAMVQELQIELADLKRRVAEMREREQRETSPVVSDASTGNEPETNPVVEVVVGGNHAESDQEV
jgi:transposase-like protein